MISSEKFHQFFFLSYIIFKLFAFICSASRDFFNVFLSAYFFAFPVFRGSVGHSPLFRCEYALFFLRGIFNFSGTEGLTFARYVCGIIFLKMGKCLKSVSRIGEGGSFFRSLLHGTAEKRACGLPAGYLWERVFYNLATHPQREVPPHSGAMLQSLMKAITYSPSRGQHPLLVYLKTMRSSGRTLPAAADGAGPEKSFAVRRGGGEVRHKKKELQ